MPTSETLGVRLTVGEVVRLIRAERDRKLAEHAGSVPTTAGFDFRAWQVEGDKLQHAYDFLLDLASAFHPDAPAFEPAKPAGTPETPGPTPESLAAKARSI